MRFLVLLSLLITWTMVPSSLGTDSLPEPPRAAPTQPHSPASRPTTSDQGLLEVHDVRNLDDLLTPIRIAHRVPALGCAVIVSNRLAGLGAVGLRKSDDPSAPVTPDDRWHHGSLTKSMTATLAAILVQRGVLRWESTLEELFPSLAPSMKPAWRSVRLDWLCSNRSGAPGDLDAGGLWLELVRFQGTPFQGRRRLLERLTRTDPVHTPGTAYEYSNAGFALAGHMLESATGKPWETLLTENLFQPLGMTSAGFGAPGKPGQINQPWGHQRLGDRNVPIEPGPSADNPPAIGPAGTMHGSLRDLSQYAAFHLRGHGADTPMLTREAMVRLHTAVPGNEGYGGGWIVTTRPWANGLVLTHAGSNRQWYSVLWLAPERQFAVAATCNLAAPSGPNPGAAATEQVVATLIRTFLPPERPGSSPPPTPQ